MAPDPLRRRFRAPAIAVATIITVGLGTTAAGPTAQAAPKPSASELREQLDQLHAQAEVLTEEYNRTRVELASAQAAAKTAAQSAASLAGPAAAARERLARLAAMNYMSGSTPDTAFLNSGGTSGLTESAYLVQRQAAVLGRLRAEIDQATRAQRDATAKATAAERAAARSETAKKTAAKKIAEVTGRLEKLTAVKVTDSRTGLTATVTGSSTAAKAARTALTQLGKPYKWAAAGPNSFDCSGLVVWAYAKVGRPGLPHYTGSLIRLGTRIERSRLRSGDLVFFGSNIHHMGIYLGDGKFLHAPQTGDVVKISKLSDRSDFAGATRI